MDYVVLRGDGVKPLLPDGDTGSAMHHPANAFSHRAVDVVIAVLAEAAGMSLILAARRFALLHLLHSSGESTPSRFPLTEDLLEIRGNVVCDGEITGLQVTEGIGCGPSPGRAVADCEDYVGEHGRNLRRQSTAEGGYSYLHAAHYLVDLSLDVGDQDEMALATVSEDPKSVFHWSLGDTPIGLGLHRLVADDHAHSEIAHSCQAVDDDCPVRSPGVNRPEGLPGSLVGEVTQDIEQL